MATVSAAEFNRNPSKMKREALEHPVVVIERNEPSVVVLSYEEFKKLQGAPKDLAEWLEADDDLELEIPARQIDSRSLPFGG